MTDPATQRSWRVVRVTDARGDAAEAPDDDVLAIEEPMEIRIEDRPIAVVMRTPGADHALAAGFTFTEGIVDSAGDIGYVKHCSRIPPDEPNNVVHVMLRRGVEVDFERLKRHTFSASSCGICGKVTMASIFVRRAPVDDGPRVSRDVIASLGERLRARQSSFESTGGVHAAALFDPDGSLVEIAEDVGRHNAVDKVIGRCVLGDAIPASNRTLMVSGRASFEIVQKAIVARIPVLVAVSAPSSLAVELADVGNLTLVAFARGDRFNIYTHPERVD